MEAVCGCWETRTFTAAVLELILRCLGSFMTNVYTVFNMEDSEETVGFAQLH